MKKKIGTYLQILAGIVMASFAVGVFYTPNKIVNGGVSGISTILYHNFNIQPGVSYATINILLLLIALKFIGKEFVLKTIVGAGLMSILVQVFSYIPPLTDNTVLSAIFGGALYGFGIGITLINNASTGGTDILGRLLQVIFPHLPIGKTLLFVDAMVVLISLLTFKSFELAMWGILALFISSLSIDLLIKKLNISKLAFIITNKGEEIATALVTSSPRGVTIIESTGAYTMASNNVLICALKERELIEFQRKVSELDEKAFIIYTESQSIYGNGFYVYR